MDIVGKTLVFTDCHLGLKNSSTSRLNIVISVFREIIGTIKSEGISNVIFCGDAFHDRRAIDVNVLNIGHKLFSTLAKYCKVYLIVGNHDCHFKSQTSVNSVNIFNGVGNIFVIDEATECTLNGSKCLLVPWLSDLSKYPENSFDMMFGHFNINSKYLIASYIEDHSKDISNDALVSRISEDEMLAGKIENLESLSDGERHKSGDLIDDFVTKVRENGFIYAGHIHNHKEFVARKRNFIFIGSPYQQNFGEMQSVDGFYVLDELNQRTFHHIDNVPVFRKLFISQIMRDGIENFDFSCVKGNIVRRVIDLDIDRLSESKINQKIMDFSPYEELLPEYEIQIGNGEDKEEVNNETLDLIKKSKLDYIRKYIDNIDDKSLQESNLDRDVLFDVLKSYYDKAEELRKY